MIGSQTFLNIAVMVASVEYVQIGDYCMFANGCFITDGPPLRRPDSPRSLAGLLEQGPDDGSEQRLVRGNVVVTSG